MNLPGASSYRGSQRQGSPQQMYGSYCWSPQGDGRQVADNQGRLSGTTVWPLDNVGSEYTYLGYVWMECYADSMTVLDGEGSGAISVEAGANLFFKECSVP
jgi:hypothetical protein